MSLAKLLRVSQHVRALLICSSTKKNSLDNLTGQLGFLQVYDPYLHYKVVS
jgi:hypothetical protein